ncbi:lactonase family protein [Sinorhizobium mexicanum]|uniref:Lactonase family protein n=1 Tax=Sinorhizobium mexicanum TaxID=375549 RepID=A0A859R8C1_9HYPH|nr:beta-propeller fold lactonase family protein [Sinorhizobium mexicanum]MBP1888078.1 6-phosphogluconolactonase [Sinorhizobium mexicanum]QLL65688.1 lactonase family protein [Sinorhizobium mexicanum]
MAENRIAIHASEGAILHSYLLDKATGSLTAVAKVKLPQKAQYGWYHPDGRHLYVASSDGGPRRAGCDHALSTLRIAPEDGRLSHVAKPQPLPARSVAICLDGDASNIISISNEPTGLSLSPIDQQGVAQAGVAQPVEGTLGTFPHQVRVVPGGEHVVVVARGYPNSGPRGPAPGALCLFRQVAGRMEPAGFIAPNGGRSFGARNLDFHPTLPVAYVGLETENRLIAFPLSDGRITPSAIVDLSTLERPEAADPRQIAGSVKVHPRGSFVYAINRADGTDAEGVFHGGENSIAVFRLDGDGLPSLTGHVPTGGIHARTFAIDPSGQWMVVANMKPRRIPGGDIVPPSVATFHLGEDGTPVPCRTHPLPFDSIDLTNAYAPHSGQRSVFWMGLTELPFAAAAKPTSH